MPKPVQASTYTLRDIIENGFLYIDKTQHLYELVRQGKGAYFLARPRRFGKSLMISTLEEIFLGNKALFEGLWIATTDYDWHPYSVVRVDFSWHAVQDAATLQKVIDSYIEEIGEAYGITVSGFDYQSRFRNLLLQLSKKDKVVILIDEYDKPIIDNLNNLPAAIEIRETLKNFYTIVKAMDRYLRFVFITGISKFSKVGVFSAMNNLDDLTMDPRFATALGITEDELRENFAEHLTALAQQEGVSEAALQEQICTWYDGFCFVRNCQRVYNPYSTLQLFNKKYFSNYWFETGTPSFLINLIKSREYDIQPLEQLEVPELTFSSYEIESLELIPLLLQTGYLTIKNFRRDEFGEIYTLSYPNYEVKSSFLAYLLSAYNQIEVTLSESHLRRLLYALAAHDLPQFFATLDIFFANIDYDLYINQERYYQTIFYLIFVLLGVRVTAEVRTNQGRIDAVVELRDHIFLFEFKLDKSAEEALKQIKEHDYTKKYRLKGKSLTLIGANFDSKQRKVTDWKDEIDSI